MSEQPRAETLAAMEAEMEPSAYHYRRINVDTAAVIADRLVAAARHEWEDAWGEWASRKIIEGVQAALDDAEERPLA